MKLLSGQFKNKSLIQKLKVNIRPTMNKIKKAIFDLIKESFNDKYVLDLYSGSGALAFESLSKGAKYAIMIDENSKVITNIINNVKNLGLNDKCRAYKNDVIKALKILKKKNMKFDVIFIDPPYNLNLCNKTLEELSDGALASNNVNIIVEHSIREELKEKYNKLKKYKERKYGKTCLSFFELEEQNG